MIQNCKRMKVQVGEYSFWLLLPPRGHLPISEKAAKREKVLLTNSEGWKYRVLCSQTTREKGN